MKTKQQILQDFSNDYLKENCVQVFDGAMEEWTYDDSSLNTAWEHALQMYKENY